MIDSILALAMLGSVLASWVIFNQANYNRKIASKLAAQTAEYAQIYAKYMNDNYSSLLVTAQNGSPTVLSPPSIGSYWKSSISTSNMFHQTPCVVILPNLKSSYVSQNRKITDLEAVMYYVGGTNSKPKKYAMVIRQALIMLGSKGGLLKNNEILGNSGWSINSDSGFITNSNQCNGDSLSDNSLAVNIDLLDQWNQDTQPYMAIAKNTDNGADQRKKPGHILNYNTSKSDITIAGHGLIVDNSDKNNPVKLKLGYGEGTNSATIGLYSNNIENNTKATADTLEPVQVAKTGDLCDQQEIGKVVANIGNNSTQTIINRSTLICTFNKMMCASNSSNTCYLPTEANRVVFQNYSTGVQSDNGNFLCPQEVPFAISAATSLGGSAGVAPIQGSLSGYVVSIGYYIYIPKFLFPVKMTQVTCSNLPDYSINEIPK